MGFLCLANLNHFWRRIGDASGLVHDPAVITAGANWPGV